MEELSGQPQKLDDKDFEAGLKQFRPILLRRAHIMMHKTEDAEEAVQTTMEKAWAARKSFDGRFFFTWVRKILDNTIKDMLRAAEVRKDITAENYENATENEEGELIDTNRYTGVSADKELGDVLDQRRAAQKALGIMSGLTPRQRQAMELTILEGKEEREVANAMRTGIGSVKTQLSRGRANIVNQLTPDDLDIIRSATNKPLKGTGAEDANNL